MSPLLEALFAADHIAVKGGIVTMPAPGVDGVKVSTNDLATKILVYAFLSAKETGAIDLSIGSKKILFVNHKFVVTTRGSTPVQTDSAFINGLYQNVVDGKTVSDAVYAWFASNQANPYAIVVQAAIDEALNGGYLVPAQQKLVGAIASAFAGVEKTERVAEKAAEIEGLRQTGIRRWDAWTAADRALMDEVMKQCAGALSLRTESRSADDAISNIDV